MSSKPTYDSFLHAPRRWDVIAMFVLTTLAAVIAVPLYGALHGYGQKTVLAALLLFAYNNMSITMGYHRLWSHRTYQARLPVRIVLALGGAFALQNSVLKWASDHRRHHRYVDDNELDPYSAKRGFWFSHMGWMLRDYPSASLDYSNVSDLALDPVLVWQHRFYLFLAIVMNVGLPALVGLLVNDLWGVLLLGGLARLVLGHHTTFFINSLAHILGRQPYSSDNTAKDNALIALLTFGEGYHNFHHAFPGDYRNAIRWYQWDPTKWAIGLLSMVGLASDLRKSDQRLENNKLGKKAPFKRRQE